nr:VWA domain-containing protein [Ferrimicrobium acidiphilum]
MVGDLQVDLASVVARFGSKLQAAGVPVAADRSGRFAAAIGLVPPIGLTELYWLGRVTLVSQQSHLEIYDRVFAQIFAGIVDPADFRGDQPPAATGAPGRLLPRGREAVSQLSQPQVHYPSWLGDVGEGRDEESFKEASLAATLSVEERLRNKDFATFSELELADLRRLTTRFAFATPRRRSRRLVRSIRGGRIDIRATLRHARRTGGEPVHLVRRRHRTRSRRLVLLCDISGSMEPYARVYLQLLLGGVHGTSAEAFVFATRLTRLTKVFKGVIPAVALDRAGRSAPDWSGGTRIGDALATFNNDYGRRGFSRGAIVVILSDGWDCGAPGVVAREMARLHLLAFRVIWVNPRKAAPMYAPLVQGMAEALPYVDTFVSGHSLVAFEEVLDVIGSAVG